MDFLYNKYTFIKIVHHLLFFWQFVEIYVFSSLFSCFTQILYNYIILISPQKLNFLKLFIEPSYFASR